MSRFARKLVLTAAVVAVLTTANFAHANQIRSSAERHQQPGHGFFVKHTCAGPSLRWSR